MADDAAAAQALAGLAMSASLMEALLKRGVIEPADADAIIRDAASYVAAFCTEGDPKVERDAQQLLTQIGKVERPPPIPIADPASS